MLCPPHTPAPLVVDWLARHRHKGSLALHILGIPPTLVGVLVLPLCVVLLSPAVLGFAVACFVGGYALQFLGHALEWSEPGEITAMRRLLKKGRRLAPAEHATVAA